MMFCSIPHEVLTKRALGGDGARDAMVELEDDGQSVASRTSFAALRAHVLRVARRLTSAGEGSVACQRGDRVAVFADNGREHIVVWLACALTGLVAVVLDRDAPPPALASILADCDAKVVMVQAEDHEAANVLKELELDKPPPVVAVELDDAKDQDLATLTAHEFDENLPTDAPFAIIYTSGTTGARKGVVRSQQSSIGGFFSHLVDMQFSKEDRFLPIFPMHGVSTFFFSIFMLYMGASVVILRRKPATDGAVLRNALSSQRVTMTTGAPGHLISIIDAAAEQGAGDLPDLRQLVSSGAMSPKETQDKIKAFFSGTRLFEIYGSTEVGIISVLCPEAAELSPGAVGVEPAGVHRSIFLDPVTGAQVTGSKEEPGEIAVHTSMMFSQYLNKQELTARSFCSNGFFRSGDIGYRDEHGAIYLLGRADDRINLKVGRFFYPSEVSRVLLRCPGISQAPVFLNEQDNQEYVVAILLGPGAASAEGAARALCEEHLPAEMVPGHFWCPSPQQAAQLPRTGTGKVQQSKLAAFFQSCQATKT